MSPVYHKCSKVLDDVTYVLQTTAEIKRLRSRINDAAVCKHASSLNSGRSCTIEYSSTIGPGALIESANYHARIRFHDRSPSYEYVTLKFLETTAVPAPRAFSYGIYGTRTNHSTGTGQGVSSSEATKNEKAKLEKHPFPKAGSLCLQSSEIEVSAVASDRFLVLTPTGPFVTSTAYYSAFTEQYLELIVDGQLYTEYPINAYLVYRFLKDNATQLASQEENQMTERFYLKHVDDKGDHILEAFGPSLVTADINALYNGKFSLSPNDLVLANILRRRGSSDLASNMTNKKVRRYFWGLALEREWTYALPLANAILKAFRSALKEYETNEHLKGLIGCSSQIG
ncbi:hypothetical protein BKA61DRAFT_628080 [Leptodontidium sp. MPI-SDFR-AT-0119]|nr:hypothetical protein BKA61DRAFT_628080 [Leptodontidium sp. MPI-SDFR-AT-0119]